MDHRLSRMLLPLLALTLLGVGSNAHAGLPADGKMVSHARKALSSKFKWQRPKILPGRWMMSHEKVSTLLAPDTAARTFEVRSKKFKDGTNLYMRGNIMFRRTATGRNNWRYDRVFFFEDSTRLEGAKPPAAAVLQALAVRGFAPGAGERRRGVFDGRRITHVYEMKLAEDIGFYMSWFDKMSFKAEFEFDRVQSRRHLIREKNIAWVHARKEDNEWKVVSMDQEGAGQRIGREAFPDFVVAQMPRLADTPVEKLSGPQRSLPIPLHPEPEELVDALASYYGEAKNLKECLPDGITSIDAIEIDPIESGPYGVDPGLFHVKGTLRYKRKNNNHGTWTSILASRSFQASFSAEAGRYQARTLRSRLSREKRLDTLSHDADKIQALPDLEQKIARGESVAPTGDLGPAQRAAPSSQQIGATIGTYQQSASEFRNIFGEQMLKTGVAITGIKIGQGGLHRLSFRRFQLDIDVDWSGKRFDGALLKQRQSYRLVLDASGDSGFHIVSSTPRGRLQSLGKVAGAKDKASTTFEERFNTVGKL